MLNLAFLQSRILPLRQFLPLALFGAVVLSGPLSVFGQPASGTRSNFPFPIPYEEETPKGQRPARTEAVLPRPLTHAEKTQLRRMRDGALRLSERSDDSFRRGLLPLGDHLRQLFASYALRQNLARLGEDDSLRSLNAEERDRYRGIVRQLENFNQPAAEGWAADLALARMYLARIEAESASLAGDAGPMYAALTRQADYAREHAQLRRFDEFLGIAPPQAVVEATQLERRAGLEALPRNPRLAEYRAAFEDYSLQLKDMANQVERWSRQGAGIGRQDKLHLARYEAAQADVVLQTLGGNEAGRKAALKTAEEELTNLFQTQREFHRRGTADLFDLARTWSDRQTLYDQASDVNDFPANASFAAHARDFQDLQTLANQTRDRRGRIAADVEFIGVLKSEQDLVALRNSLTDPFRETRR